MLQPIAWLLLAAIHLTPALAAIRPALLTRLYRIPPESPLFVLMQHRAALFAAVVAACVIAAFHAPSRPLAVAVTGISMVSFLILYAAAGQPAALRTIARVDLMGLVPLGIVALLAFRG
jgi:hypothetical protein